LIIWWTIAWLVICSPSAAIIFGSDDLEPVGAIASQLPFSAVGLLRGPGGACTAVLIGTDLALSAAHCFVNRGQVDGYEFVSTVEVDGVRPHVSPIIEISLGQRPQNESSDRDFAVARLLFPLGRELGFLPIARSPARGDRVREVGFVSHIDGGKTLVQDSDCQIRDEGWDHDVGYTLLHDCDSVEQSSGSPLLREGRNGWEIVGIDVSSQVSSERRRVEGVPDRMRAYRARGGELAVNIATHARLLREFVSSRSWRPSHRTGIRYCNLTDSRLQLAIAWPTERSWSSAGWKSVLPRACKVFAPPDARGDRFYLHASGHDSVRLPGGRPFCGKRVVFEIKRADRCEQGGESLLMPWVVPSGQVLYLGRQHPS
jgi:uncharacterized membrane protein